MMHAALCDQAKRFLKGGFDQEATCAVLLIWWPAKVWRSGRGGTPGGLWTYALNSHCRLNGTPLELASACHKDHFNARIYDHINDHIRVLRHFESAHSLMAHKKGIIALSANVSLEVHTT
jgi:hypothetical protein